MLSKDSHPSPSPARMLEILTDRFAAFEAVANSTIKLARASPADAGAWRLRAGRGGCILPRPNRDLRHARPLIST